MEGAAPQNLVVCVASDDVLTIDDAANGTLRFGLYHLARFTEPRPD